MAEMSPGSPHAAYDRYMRNQRRLGAWLRSVGGVAFYVFAVLMALVLAWLTVAGIVDLGQPRQWGTFTQTDCEPRPRGGCRPVGIWVRDDGQLVKRDVYLDGWPDESGSTRASYQPDAIISDESNSVVHAEGLTGAGPWVAGATLIWWVSYVIHRAASWGDIRIGSRRPRPRTAPSPRREFRESRAQREDRD
jgi:hypothetical protein